MPKLAAFPKAFMVQLCKDGSMNLREWVDLAKPLGLEGLEFYSGFLELGEESNWGSIRAMVEGEGMCVPMMCCSPDFTHPDPAFRKAEIDKEKRWIDMAAALGAETCRVLSGQRRPEVGREEGIRFAAESIESCLDHAEKCGIQLVIENHYKDDFWEYPEFAQMMDVFCDLVEAVDDPRFGVNFDPSNTILAGEDPIELLKRVSKRVITMHASDRFLLEGTLEDLRREEAGVEGYARRLSHGEIGKGLNDYDAIFGELSRVGFDGWISIEDGVEGMEQLERSVVFLRDRMSKYWGD